MKYKDFSDKENTLLNIDFPAIYTTMDICGTKNDLKIDLQYDNNSVELKHLTETQQKIVITGLSNILIEFREKCVSSIEQVEGLLSNNSFLIEQNAQFKAANAKLEKEIESHLVVISRLVNMLGK